jgi:IS30 family transposase
MAHRLSRAEREEIRVCVTRGWSYRRIGCHVGRHWSTVQREVVRNGGRDGYVAAAAHQRAETLAARPKVPRLVTDKLLARRVRQGLESMSPAPLCRVLADEGISISPETIYRELFRDGSVFDDAWERLAHARRYRKRRNRRHGPRRDSRPLGDIRLVTTRRALIPDEPGHWEGDLIVGADNRSAAVVITERTSRRVLLGALRSQTSREVTRVVIELLTDIPPHLRQTLCWDQGRELAAWPNIENTLGTIIYFCHPRSPWQKPLVEHTCGLLRRWLPRNTNLYRPQPDLDTIAHTLNTTPRRSLNWTTPNTRYAQLVATTT